MKQDIRERFTLRVPTALFCGLQEKAEVAGVSLNALILQILWDWREREETRQKDCTADK